MMVFPCFSLDVICHSLAIAKTSQLCRWLPLVAAHGSTQLGQARALPSSSGRSPMHDPRAEDCADWKPEQDWVLPWVLWRRSTNIGPQISTKHGYPSTINARRLGLWTFPGNTGNGHKNWSWLWINFCSILNDSQLAQRLPKHLRSLVIPCDEPFSTTICWLQSLIHHVWSLTIKHKSSKHQWPW